MEQALRFYFIFEGLECERKYSDILCAIDEQILSRADEINAHFNELFKQNANSANALLIKLARNQRGVFSLVKSTHDAKVALNMLLAKGIINLEKSPQIPPVRIKGEKLKKHIRRYKIQDKVHFAKGFYHFWFSFCAKNTGMLKSGAKDEILEFIAQNLERFYSHSFELACIKLIAKTFNIQKCEVTSYWQKGVEIDIYALAQGKLIVGEVKYKEHKVCKSLLSKLQAKCELCGLKPDYYALCSLNGFSSELTMHAKITPNVLLFSLNDFKAFL